MKQIVIDFSSTGLLEGVKHFARGILLAAAIGAVSYALAYLKNYHVATSTADISAALLFANEFLQGVAKWLTTAQAETVIASPLVG